MRFALLVGVFAAGSFVLHNYVSLNIGLRLALLQAIAYFVQLVGAGVVISLIYRPVRLLTLSESVLEQLFAAGDAGDVESFATFLHHDVVVHAPMGLSTIGLVAEQDSWRRAKSAMRDLHHQFLSVLKNEQLEAARCVVTGTLDGSYGEITAVDKPFKVDQALFARLRDGKIEELWEIVDTASLLGQLGSDEPSDKTEERK